MAQFKKGNEVISSEYGRGVVEGNTDMFIYPAVRVRFDKRGLKLCYHSDTGKRVEDYGTDSISLVQKPVIAVKRRAKVGEYVKIVRKFGYHDAFDVGDICKVIKDEYGCFLRIRTKRKAPYYAEEEDCKQPFSLVDEGEYIVLENYKPKQKEPFYVNSDAMEPDENKLRKWTEEEIKEAKCIAYECIFIPRMKFLVENKDDGDERFFVNKDGKRYTSKPCKTDEPNEHIGRMVTLCKATGRELPNWIQKGERQ